MITGRGPVHERRTNRVKLDLFDAELVSRPAGRLLVSVAAAAMVTLLCTPPVRRAFRYAVEPRLDRARKPVPTS
ncbi:hypothetical protein [Streptomyces sp. NPDC057428]|uniref:hypothetical protein n=1 Tax=Streptomyces sp. NPDC057428 TaxID=3346129 RepID=UPI0036A84F98